MPQVTEEDVLAVWPYHLTYLVQIINGEYSVESAREDVLGLIGSSFDPRTKEAPDAE